jgi:hypothetical protein
MRLSIRKFTVTTPKEVLRCRAQDIHNFNIHGDSSFEVGDAGFTVGDGEPVAAGGNWGFTHLDFKNPTGDLIVYAGASSACNIVVTSWLED